MKNLVYSLILLNVLLSSCSAEKWFNIGISKRTAFSRSATKSLEQLKDKAPYDVIIVPGVPYDPSSASSIMRVRILWAKYLFDNGIAKNIIFSGAAVYTPYYESTAMKLIADSLGIPSGNTFCETMAEHSTENVYYSWKMAKALGFEKIALATDPFQSFMLKRFIRNFCPEVEAVPAVFDKIRSDDALLPAIDLTHVYVDDFVSLPERETLRQRLAGTRGRRVKEEVRGQQLASKNFPQQSGSILSMNLNLDSFSSRPPLLTGDKL